MSSISSVGTERGNEPVRGKFRGVLEILRFNWRLYLLTAAAALVGAVLFCQSSLASGVRHAVGCGVFAAIAWSVTSLAVSHWVYDRSELCRWRWVARIFPFTPARWVNIHAGLDESTGALRRMFPGSVGAVLDIFDPNEMTEASIGEARRQAAGALPAKRADFRALPFGNAVLDAIFLIFAAHEIRRPESRLEFFHELRRVLRPGGRVLLVEHLRDWANFAAFGAGFFHFLPRREWLRLAGSAGLEVEREFGVTPFVRILLLRRSR